MSGGFDGNGNYVRYYNWTQDAANGVPITASRFDTEHNGFATALSNCITRDGQGKPIADIDWNTHKIKNLADPTLPQDAVTLAFLNGTSGLLQIQGSQVVGTGTLTNTVIKYPQTAAELAASVTPVNLYYPPGHLLRYGTNTTPGTTDMRTALQNALNSNTSVFIPDDDFYISGSVTPQNNSIIYGLTRKAQIIIKDGDTTGIDLTGLTGVEVRGLKLSCKTLTGTLGGVNGKAAIYMSGSSQCKIRDCFIFNIYNHGIFGLDSSNNTITGNYFGDWFTTGTTNDDASNIFLMGACTYNIVSNNLCLGANAANGIAIHDYYLVGKQPIGNNVCDNVVIAKRAYGILLYTTTTGTPAGFDCKTNISGNVVSGILGSAIGGASGAGIYLQGAGGAICTNNQIYNCCVNTTDFSTLAMSCLTASITQGVSTAPITVSNNQVHSLKGPCIRGTSSGYFGIKIENNDCQNDQTSASNDSCIVMTDCRYSSVSHNTCRHSGPGTAIYFLSTAVFGTIPTMLRIAVIGNTIESTAGDGITIDRTSTGAHEEYTITGNNVYVSAASKRAAAINYMTHVAMTGNTFVSNLSDPLYASNITKLRGAGNVFRSNSTGSITLSGTDCTLDETNYFGATMNNSGGFITFHLLDAAPASGTWAVGDAVIRRTATIGGAKGWRCTTAGTPGTWTSEGNL